MTGSAEQGESSPPASDDDATAEIMAAVYRALSKNGYPELTMSQIADEFEKSKSLLYYHYDGKEELLNDFFVYLCERLEATLVEQSTDDPYEQLLALIDQILPAELDDEQLRFRQAFLEIRSQAPHNRSYHEQIERSDELVLDALTRTIERGIETGRFEPVDPERYAEFVFSTLYGAMQRGVTLEDRETIERNRTALREQLERSLLRDQDAS